MTPGSTAPLVIFDGTGDAALRPSREGKANTHAHANKPTTRVLRIESSKKGSIESQRGFQFS